MFHKTIVSHRCCCENYKGELFEFFASIDEPWRNAFQDKNTQVYKEWARTVTQEVKYMFRNNEHSSLVKKNLLGEIKFKEFKKTASSRVGVRFSIVIKKPHWNNNKRIEEAFAELAILYKNQSKDDDTVLGKPINGMILRNSYIVDDPPSSHSAKRIPWDDPVDEGASSGGGDDSKSESGSGDDSKEDEKVDFPLMLTLIPTGAVLIVVVLVYLVLNRKTCQIKLCC